MRKQTAYQKELKMLKQRLKNGSGFKFNLVDPDGEIHQGNDLREFLKSNVHLFPHSDIRLLMASFYKLNPKHKRHVMLCYGWRWNDKSVEALVKEGLTKNGKYRNPAQQKQIENLVISNALTYQFKSPTGKIYKGQNIGNFISNNPKLFTEDEYKKAHDGLGSLNPKRKRAHRSWHGWTWVID